MASKLAVALMEEDAIKRIEQALPGFVMPRQGRDPMLMRAQRLAAIADYLEGHTAPEATETSVMMPISLFPLKAMNVTQLSELAQFRGVVLGEGASKASMIAALEAQG